MLGGRGEDVDAVRAAGVDDDLARPQRVGGGEAADHAGERVVRQGEQHEVGAADHLVRREERHAGQQFLGALHGLLGHTGGGDDRVAGTREGGTEHRTDAAGGDHPDGKARRPVHAASPLLDENDDRSASCAQKRNFTPRIWRSPLLAGSSAFVAVQDGDQAGPRGRSASAPARPRWTACQRKASSVTAAW